jgi:hypothetical protein
MAVDGQDTGGTRARRRLLLFSARAALAGGLLLPAAETARRWGTGHYWLWVDDYLVGAALLFAAFRARRDPAAGRPWLIAAWAFACGIGYSSFLGHVLRWREADVGRFPHMLVIAAIGLGLALALLGLWAALRAPATKEN